MALIPNATSWTLEILFRYVPLLLELAFIIFIQCKDSSCFLSTISLSTWQLQLYGLKIRYIKPISCHRKNSRIWAWLWHNLSASEHKFLSQKVINKSCVAQIVHLLSWECQLFGQLNKYVLNYILMKKKKSKRANNKKGTWNNTQVFKPFKVVFSLDS